MTDRVSSLTKAGTGAIAAALSARGLWLDLGSATVRVRGDVPAFAEQLRRVYGDFDFRDEGDWSDVDAVLELGRGWRRWVRPQVEFRCDGLRPFEPFPAEGALPLFEWSCNWLLSQRVNDRLLLHAGALERDGIALVLPALPGSGKSTLTAALAHRGWRLLSDEFAAFDPVGGAFHAMLKPVALKNRSIDVIRAFAPEAVIGPVFPKTRKGDVAHVAAPATAVMRRHEPAWPGAFVLPKWKAGAVTKIEPVSPRMLFAALSFNSFNYRLLGRTSFEAAAWLARRCTAWHVVYSDLEDFLGMLDGRLWPQVRARSLLASVAATNGDRWAADSVSTVSASLP